MGKGQKEPTEEENVITPEEFEELEKKEFKKKFGVFGKKAEQKARPKQEDYRERKGEEPTIENLLLKIEKIEGKLEALDGLRTATDERISRLTEEIGELRSALLERERAFNQIESDFSKMKEMSSELKPEKILASLAQKDNEISKAQARMEAAEVKLAEMGRAVKEVKDTFSKIKSFENMMLMLQDVEKNVRQMEEYRKDMSRTAGKVEAMFSELTARVQDFQNYKEKIDFNEDTMHEVMKTVDEYDVKLEKFVKKDDLKGFKESIDKLRTEHDDKIQDIKDVVSKLVVSLKKKGVGEIAREKKSAEENFVSKAQLKDVRDSINAILDRMKELEKSRKEAQAVPRKLEARIVQEKAIEVPKVQVPKPQFNIVKEHVERTILNPMRMESDAANFDELIEDTNDSIDLGEIDEARLFYDKALTLYTKMKVNLSPEEANIFYAKIKKAYDRLNNRARMG